MSRHAVAASDVPVPAFDYSAVFHFAVRHVAVNAQHAYSAWPLRKTVLSSLSGPDTFAKIYDARSVMRDQK